jgi:hypothetical protein
MDALSTHPTPPDRGATALATIMRADAASAPSPQADVASARVEKLRDSFGLLSPSDLATLIGRDERTLAVWRSQKRGPDWVALGRSIFYTRAAVETWISMNVTLADRTATGSGE